MVTLKNHGIRYSEYVIDAINKRYADETRIGASYETFYNCREMGYVLRVHDEDYEDCICIWIYGQRNSDEPTITWEETIIPMENANMFNEESYYERTKTFNNVDDASEYAIDIIEEHFKLKDR